MILTICVVMSMTAAMIVGLLRMGYDNSIQTITEQVLSNARDSFANLENNDVRTLSASLTPLLEDPYIKQTFLQQDRKGLHAVTAPTFDVLKKQFHITHWYFHYPETGPQATAKKCFLRVHNLPKHSDVITRFTYEGAVKSKTFSSGKELGKTAFALRVVHPFYHNGQLIGYMELGQEIDHFLGQMKKQTRSDLGILIKKQYLDREKWKSIRETKGLRDNWNDQKDVLLVDQTDSSVAIFDSRVNIDDVPAAGKILGRLSKGSQIFVRGIFPIYDAGNRKVGGVFFVHDVTGLYLTMRKMQGITVAVILAFIVLMSALIMFVFNKLIIDRFQRLSKVLTCVVGGDFESKIVSSSNDEIGQFETLFEQLRQLFVNTLKQKNES